MPDELSDRHFRSQFTYIFDHEANLLADFIGNFSSYRQDMKSVLTKLNMGHLDIPHYNKTSHKNYEEYYTPDLIKQVGVRYAIDNEIFGFKFGKQAGPEFYSSWKRELSTDLKLKIIEYKSRKLIHCLQCKEENTILMPKTIRNRLRILLKGK